MSGFDVHTDKAMKELRARLDQAERERDEARQHARAAERDAVEAEAKAAALTAERDEAGRAFRDLVAVLDRDGGQRQAGETVAATRERAVQLAADLVVGEPARIAAAEMARDVAWVRMVCRSANRPEAVEAIGRALVISPAAAGRVYDADYNDDAAWSDIAAAIRAARGAL